MEPVFRINASDPVLFPKLYYWAGFYLIAIFTSHEFPAPGSMFQPLALNHILSITFRVKQCVHPI